MDCAITGDSIAVGLASQRLNCTITARVGLSSSAIIGMAGNTDVLVISAGSNDPHSPRLADNLRRIRGSAARAVWIVPANPTAARTVLGVAAEHGDAVVRFRPGPDGMHPRDYPALAEAVRWRVRAGR